MKAHPCQDIQASLNVLAPVEGQWAEQEMRGDCARRGDEDVADAMGSWKGDYAKLGQVGCFRWNTALLVEIRAAQQKGNAACLRRWTMRV